MQNSHEKNKIWTSARKAFASMEEFCIKPSTNNYAVWLAYHSKSHPALIVEIDTAFDNGKAVDDYMLASLYDNHLEKAQINETLIAAGGTFENELREVINDFEKVKTDTNEYSKKLTYAKEVLDNPSDQSNLSKVVEDLSTATNIMIEKSAKLEERIDLSRQEIAALKDELEKVRTEAARDALTGVANRKTFNNFLNDSLKECDASRKPLSIVMTDIDHFKKVNDKWGHQTGDQVICFVAGVLNREAPSGSLVARLGGEEFAIIAPNLDARSAKDLAERIRTSVEKKKLIRRNSKEDLGQITVSMGVAERILGETGVDFVERADQALYASKNRGRNRTSLYDKSFSKAA